MSGQDLDESFKKALLLVSKDEGLRDVTLEIQSGAPKANNFMGRVHRVRAHGIRGNEQATLNLFLKTCANESIRHSVPFQLAYQRESYVYRKVHPELKKIQDTKDMDLGSGFSFVKCYYTSNRYLNEMIVLEDLEVQGFTMFDRMKSVDFSHAALVMKTLGKLHALSYALKENKPEIFKELISNCPDILCHGPFGKSTEHFFKISSKQCLDVIEEPMLKSIIEKFSKEIIPRMRAATSPCDKGVLMHGDLWINNILYKYQSGVPADVRLIDFQMTRYGSPALDLLYFLYTATDQEFRTNHFYTMLDLYYASLAACLREHSLDIEIILTKRDLLREMVQFSDYGLGVAFMGLRWFLNDSVEVPKLADVLGDEGNAKLSMPTGDTYRLFVERVNGVASDYVKYSSNVE